MCKSSYLRNYFSKKILPSNKRWIIKSILSFSISAILKKIVNKTALSDFCLVIFVLVNTVGTLKIRYLFREPYLTI